MTSLTLLYLITLVSFFGALIFFLYLYGKLKEVERNHQWLWKKTMKKANPDEENCSSIYRFWGMVTFSNKSKPGSLTDQITELKRSVNLLLEKEGLFVSHETEDKYVLKPDPYNKKSRKKTKK